MNWIVLLVIIGSIKGIKYRSNYISKETEKTSSFIDKENFITENERNFFDIHQYRINRIQISNQILDVCHKSCSENQGFICNQFAAECCETEQDCQLLQNGVQRCQKQSIKRVPIMWRGKQAKC